MGKLKSVAIVLGCLATLPLILSLIRRYRLAKKSKAPLLSVLSFIFSKNANESIRTQLVEPVGLLQFMGFSAVVIGDAELAKFVLKDEGTLVKTVFQPSAVLARFGGNMVFANGSDWKRHRDSVGSFFSADSIRSFIPAFVQKAGKVIDKLSSFPEGHHVDFNGIIMKSTLDVLGQTILGYEFGALDEKLNETIESYQIYVGELNNPLRMALPSIQYIPFLKTNKDLLKAVDHLHNFFDSIVKEKIEARKMKKVEYYDMADVLVDAYLDETSNNKLSKKELFADLLLFFIAGHETTTAAICWFFISMAKYPEIQEKVIAEIDSVLEGQLPTVDSLKDLVYLQYVLKESMRMLPPIGLLPTRGTLEDFPLPGTEYLVPKGSRVALSIYSIHRNPKYWKNPDEFDPDRFSPQNSAGRHPFAFLPFSLGKRHCTGSSFALAEQQIFAAMILQKFKVELVGKFESIHPRKGFMNGPSSFRLIFKKRE